MTVIHAQSALLPDGWTENVRLILDRGMIASVETGVSSVAGDETHAAIVPAMANLHSHAFQRAMAGLAEMRGPDADSFWSWRTVMYRFALQMSPDQVQAVAAQLYVEMLEAGFGRVGEFHYLHHAPDGRPYADIGEMALRIAAAAGETGIGLTILPVFYAHSGFGGAAPIDGQRRFISSLDQFSNIVDTCRSALRDLPGGAVGVAPHSLRAVTPDELTAMTEIAAGGPIHIHVSEQIREVEDCIAWSGARPVEWLLANAGLDKKWCLIHATHMTDDETRRMARSGAVAGLCPITEANLGDGTFPATVFLEAGGRFGVGSDSNVLIGISDELRQLEYSQRLHHRARNVFAPANGSTGRTLFDGAIIGGAQALGIQAVGANTGLVQGMPADLVSLDLSGAPYLKHDQILDAWIFAGSIRPDCVWSNGKKQVSGGRHIDRDKVEARFRSVMQALVAA